MGYEVMDEVTQEDLSWPTIIDKKINTISWSNVNFLEVPDISIVEYPFESNISVQIWYSINKPDNIAKRPINAFALYSRVLIQLILNMERYFNKII